MQVVWFKRDLRVEDHAPLADAGRSGPFLALYIYEPRMMAAPEYGANQHEFVEESLEELDAALTLRGGMLIRAHGHARDVLSQVHQVYPFNVLRSHMETGHALSYRRDKVVQAWCRNHGIDWIQAPTCEVQRPHPIRDGWSRRWYQRVRSPLVALPESFESVPPPDFEARCSKQASASVGLGVAAPLRQLGGRSRALSLLNDFIRQDPGGYLSNMSSPVTAPTACSRLSPHLAVGTVSTREIIHRLDRARRLRPEPARRKGYAAFESRLAWRGHFMQRLEDEGSIETHCLDPMTEAIRRPGAHWGGQRLSEELIEARMTAWQNGTTGWPMVDACMRSLVQTGWLSFRMRAMVVSVACYTLGIDWRRINAWLARQFTDYEPGIHLNQLQMQSGSTGLNELRIYNPVRQAQVHDPNGHFIRRWVPELVDVPTEQLHRIGEDSSLRLGDVAYPNPLVNMRLANRQARGKITALRQRPESKQAARGHLARLGSRRNRSRGSRRS